MGVISELNKAGAEMSLFSELILGLPEETWQTHLDANKKLMDLGAQVHNYNLHLLPGTEMDRKDIRKSISNEPVGGFTTMPLAYMTVRRFLRDKKSFWKPQQ